jgi:hypothetical protein
MLMLRKELKESDIPGRTTIRNRILEMLGELLSQLEEDMKVSLQLVLETPTLNQYSELCWKDLIHQ